MSRYQMRAYGFHRWLPRTLMLVMPSTAMAVAVAACDTAPPVYQTQESTIRLVPEQATIDSAGGTVFVLVELARADQSAPVITYLRAEGALIKAPPGPEYCKPPTAEAGPDAPDVDAGLDGAADADAEAMPDVGPIVDPAAGTLVLPYAALLDDSARKVKESGVLVVIPAGEGDALLVVSAYRHGADPHACSAANEQLVALSSLRIARAKPDASVEDAANDGPVEDAANDGPEEATSDADTADTMPDQMSEGGPTPEAGPDAPPDTGTDGDGAAE